ncbi:hypothetical protein [Helicobacter vulpis]|uniref:hypothetical protein n=1 Tax=Helicobacter vulpis TaxID=2316076 RepID=UPI000EAFD22C|nr:hypothetical protein [Helicobacter vulpis]
MKKVIVNASALMDPKNDLAGCSFYVLTLVQALEKHFKDRDVEITLYAYGKLYANLEELLKFRSLSL